MKDNQHAAILELRRVLSQKILPRISSPESLRMILAQRPLRLPPDVTVKRRPAPSLKISPHNRSNHFLGDSPQEGMHAIRYPYLCYVTEGEIDIRLGIAAKHGKMRSIVNRYEVLSLPEGSLLLIPPGVYFPYGEYSHWERDAKTADARIFWVHILPTGVLCHTSTMHNAVHTSDNIDAFVPGQSFAATINLLEDDLRFVNAEAAMVGRNLLASFFARIAWKLSEGTRATLASDTEWNKQENIHPGGNSLVIQRARDFIRSHNGIAFTVEDVAAYAYVSPTHLMRLFRTKLHTTVMDYALKQRLAVAETWLENSEMPIKQIASELGYSHAPQFNRIFKQIYSISPTEFRRRCRK